MNLIFNLGGWVFDFSGVWIQLLSLLLLISFFLTAFSTYKRLAFRSKWRWWAVMTTNLAAYSSILLLLIMPGSEQPVDSSVSLLTEGAIAGSAYSGHQYATADFVAENTKTVAMAEPEYLSDSGQLPLREPALSRLEVVGFGLDKAQWSAFPQQLQLDFKPPPLTGPVDLRWSRQLFSGERLQISGRWLDPGSGSITELVLTDPAGMAVDEIRVRDGDRFSLSSVPRSAGNLVYTLGPADKQTQSEAVTVFVAIQKPVMLMVQQSAPSFESRALKNWAAGNGTTVIVQSQTSLDSTITQWVNVPKFSPDSTLNSSMDNTGIIFSPQLLSRLDLLIMDGRALVALRQPQLTWLESAVQNGLGLLVFLDDSLLAADPTGLLAGLELKRDANLATEVIPYWRGRNPGPIGEQKMPVANIKIATTPGKPPSGRSLISDASGRTLNLVREYGLGRVSITALRERHRWLTSGRRDLYGQYWSRLMTEIARPNQQSYLLPATETSIAQARQHTDVCAMSKQTDLAIEIRLLPAGVSDSLQMVLPADPMGSQRRCSWFYPPQAGWYSVSLKSLKDDNILDTKNIYVSSASQWLSHKRWQRQLATRQRATQFNTASSSPDGITWQQIAVPVKLFWPWFLLLLSCTALWLERKLDFDW